MFIVNSKKSRLADLIKKTERELSALDNKRDELLQQLSSLRKGLVPQEGGKQGDLTQTSSTAVDFLSPPDKKIALFRSLFRGREDVFPLRFESLRTGRSGYQPACHNEWISGICKKPRGKCSDCEHRQFIPVSDEVISHHLRGAAPNLPQKEYCIGVYPMLVDETCWFLAADFDKDSWMEDTKAFLSVCKAFEIPAALERSRSGKGGHIWIFFAEEVSASTARKMGTYLLTETMEQRPELGLESYDRFFPSQDTLPQGGLGNLIALPLQGRPRRGRRRPERAR